MNLAAFRAAIGSIPVDDHPRIVQQKSRDHYWYSPILKAQLDHVTADLVVSPRTQEEVVTVLAAAFAHDVPVTPRGAGTGNYGQAMPLRGGIVLEMGEFNRVLWTRPGVVRAQAGVKMIDLDAHCRREVGGELRFHPSTRRTATLGGFVAGGSSGIGSTGYGILREPGNILGLKVMTMEAEPRVLELRGADIQKANHAYGTNGVITELEMPLAPAWEWVDVVVAFPTLMGAARFADAVTRMDGVPKKLACVVPAPIPQLHFKAWGSQVPAGHAVAMLMVAAPFLDILPDVIAAHGGTEVRREASDAAEVPLYEHSWNHTTLQVLKTDKGITYLQTLFAAPDHLDLIARMERMFGDEVLLHLEFVRFSGTVCAFGLQVVRFTSEERLAEIIRLHEEAGAPIFNPHSFTLEEGGMKHVDAAQLAFKREADPKGLLNPGKMLAWDDPDWRPGRNQAVRLYETDYAAPAEVLE
jgi:FAD/FMN-containing dehydrogenase